jgi:two-component sensor histidine kinase/putative methionine-R-sulfoxide reductase with GAF domain
MNGMFVWRDSSHRSGEDVIASRDLTKLLRHQQVLLELAHLTAEKLPSESLLQNAAAEVGRGVEIDHVKIMRYRPESGDLLAEAGIGWRDGVIGHATFPTDLSSPPGRAFQTGQPVVIPNANVAEGFRISPVLIEHGIQALLNVPIQIDGAAWGVLEVDSEGPRDFSLDTLEFMLTVASMLASALRREQVDQAHEQALAMIAREIHRQQVLLQEMQHRMKNNFQTILAMVTSQATRSGADNSRHALEKIAAGIMAMSLAHDQLAPSQGGGTVNLPTYLRVLATGMQKPLDSITVEVQADEVSVPIEQAVAIGLIVNELVTNSVKHAFGQQGGSVRVELTSGPGNRQIQLKVSDNGTGIDQSRPAGSGLRLISALARQIRGRIERTSSDQGTTTCVIVPLP